MTTYVLRLWLADRPGVLGAVASRVGSVGGDVVGIEILERGAGRAVDELAIVLEDASLEQLLVTEVTQVDGVEVEELRPVGGIWRDPRLDALETAAVLVGAHTPEEALDALCEHALLTLGAHWSAVVDQSAPLVSAARGAVPGAEWLAAFVAGSQTAARSASFVSEGADVSAGPTHERGAPEDVLWAPLPAANHALVLGRDGLAFRGRERHQAAALARIVDTRFRELNVLRSRRFHPSAALQ